jgi:hypothetical protein
MKTAKNRKLKKDRFLEQIAWVGKRLILVVGTSLILLLLVVGSLGQVQSIARSLGGDELYSRKDIIQDWLLAKAILTGGNPYLPIQDLAQQYLGPIPTVQDGAHPTPHPPTAGLILIPMAFFQYSTVVYSWLLIEVICLIAASYFMLRTVEFKRVWIAIAILIPVFLVWGEILENLFLAQLVILQLFLLSAGWFCLKQERFVVAGLLVGFSLLIKPTVWPVAFIFLIHRKYRGILACVAVVLTGYTVSAIALGTATVYNYFAIVIPAVDKVYASSIWNISLRTLGPKLFEGTSSSIYNAISAPPLFDAGALAMPVGVLLPLLLILSVVLAARRVNILAGFALLTGITIVVSPVAWGTYVVMLAILMMWLVHRFITGEMRKSEAGTGVILMLILFPQWKMWVVIAQLLAGQTTTPSYPITIGAGVSLVTMIPTMAVVALLGLTLRLETRYGYSIVH